MSHSVTKGQTKRPNIKNKQGDHPCVVSDGPTKRPQHMRICSLINCTYLLFHYRVTNRLLSYPDLRLFRWIRFIMACSKNTCCWPIALPLPCMTETLLRIATWLCLAIKQVCVRRSTSVSHSMARLPVWSPAWGNIEITRLADLDGSCALLIFFLSPCFLFFFPVRTCTSFFLGSKGSENVVIGRRHWAWVTTYHHSRIAPSMNQLVQR